MLYDELAVGYEIFRGEEALFLVFSLLLGDALEDDSDGSMVNGQAGDDCDLVLDVYSSAFLTRAFNFSVGFESLMLGLALFLTELNSFCFLYPGVCLCSHVVVPLSLSCPLCFSMLGLYYFGGPVEFFSVLCPPQSPEVCFLLLSCTEFFSVLSRFFTLGLRMSMNLLVGHVLVCGAWGLAGWYASFVVKAVELEQRALGVFSGSKVWYVVWLLFMVVKGYYWWTSSAVFCFFGSVVGVESGFTLFQIFIFCGLLVMYEREICVYRAHVEALWKEKLCPRYWAAFYSMGYQWGDIGARCFIPVGHRLSYKEG